MRRTAKQLLDAHSEWTQERQRSIRQYPRQRRSSKRNKQTFLYSLKQFERLKQGWRCFFLHLRVEINIQWEYVWMGGLFYPVGFDWMLYAIISRVNIIVLILRFYP